MQNTSKTDAIEQALRAVKSTPRTGWMLRGVPAAVAETIAAHMAESTVLALLIGERLAEKGVQVDVYHAASIAAVHDIAEGFIGDLVKRATDAIGKDVKETLEIDTLRQEIGESIISRLAEEYVRQETIEARVAKAAETMSTLLQALRYLRQGYDVAEILCGMLNIIMKTEPPPLAAALQELFRTQIDYSKKICKLEKANKE